MNIALRGAVGFVLKIVATTANSEHTTFLRRFICPTVGQLEVDIIVAAETAV